MSLPEFKGRFCSMPFVHARIEGPKGRVNLCCGPRILGQKATAGFVLEDGALAEIWNSERAREFRRTILDGSYRYCNRQVCPKFNGDSSSLPRFDEITDEVFVDIIRNNKLIAPPPRALSFNYDSSCNIKCPQCREDVHIATGDDLKRIKLIHERVLEDLEEPERIVITGSGDALASPVYREYLLNYPESKLVNTNITLRTNGLLLTESFWGKITEAKKHIDVIQISIDAATEETYSLVRRGGNFNKLCENMQFLSGVRASGEIEVLRFNFCVQKRNFREMVDFVRMCKEWNADFVEFSIIRVGGELTDEIKEHAVHLEGHPLRGELMEILKNPVFNEPYVFIGGQLDRLISKN